MSIKQAFILAAGRGERLRPLTDSTPKPLIRVGAHTLIEHHLLALADAGVNNVVINVAHLGQKIIDYVGNGRRFGMEIRYSEEPDGALETAGGIRHALALLDEPAFLVVNGDIRCDLDFSSLHLAEKNNMHLVMVPNPPHHPDGDFWLFGEQTGGMLGNEAGTSAGNARKLTFSGIGIYRRALFTSMEQGKAPLAPVIRRQIDLGTVSASLHRGRWTDVGTLQRLQQARADESGQASGSCS